MESVQGEEKAHSASISIETVVQPTLQTLDQNKSPLFALPFEIRALLWKEVAGGSLVHITELNNKLGHIRCMDRTNTKWGTWQHDCWYCSLKQVGQHVAPEAYGRPEDRLVKPGSLGMLRSCRRVYGEAINAMYQQITFDVRGLNTLDRFLASLPPGRISHITSLHLSPPVNPDFKAWESMWNSLSTILNLKTLRVELRGNLKDNWPWSNVRLLTALCCFEQTEVFEVKVSWELEQIQDWIWAMPFRLEGVFGEVIESGEREYLALLRRERVDIRDWLFPKSLCTYIVAT